jgi:hypothetical protein
MAWRPPIFFAIGDKVAAVEHPEYGVGTVWTEVDCGDYQTLTVHFEHRGNKTVITTLTPLRKIEETSPKS